MKISHRDKYMGNPNLPVDNAQFEYSEEMIKEIALCSKNIIHFAEKYFHIVSVDEGKKLIELYKPQKRLLKSLADNRFVCCLASRQVGKTSMLTIYALWVTLFSYDKRILIVANKEDTAIMILRRIRLAYEMLPNWLKSGVKQWGKTEIIFTNDSSISVSTTTVTAGIGQSINVLIIDECVHGDTQITIRNKKTHEIKNIGIKELFSNSYS